MDKKAAGERFIEFLKAISMKQIEFAKSIGIPQPNISKYRNGDLMLQNISIELYALGCNLNWLFAGEEHMFADNVAGRLHSKRLNPGKDVPESNVQDVSSTEMVLVPNFTNWSPEQIRAYFKQIESIYPLLKKFAEIQDV